MDEIMLHVRRESLLVILELLYWAVIWTTNFCLLNRRVLNAYALWTGPQEDKLLRMGDEISRLAAFESECHRKELVIADLRQQLSGRIQTGDEANKLVEELSTRLKTLESVRDADKQQIETLREQVS